MISFNATKRSILTPETTKTEIRVISLGSRIDRGNYNCKLIITTRTLSRESVRILFRKLFYYIFYQRFKFSLLYLENFFIFFFFLFFNIVLFRTYKVSIVTLDGSLSTEDKPPSSTRSYVLPFCVSVLVLLFTARRPPLLTHAREKFGSLVFERDWARGLSGRAGT